METFYAFVLRGVFTKLFLFITCSKVIGLNPNRQKMDIFRTQF